MQFSQLLQKFAQSSNQKWPPLKATENISPFNQLLKLF